MTDADLIPRTRNALGPVGAILGVRPDAPPIAEHQQALARLESVGWRAVWTNELVGTDALVRAALWLGATQHLVVGTCIANVWARPAQSAHAAATQLAQAYPDRFVLGLGVGRPDQAAAVGCEFGSPSSIARSYLSDLPAGEYPRLLAANGPKLLSVAGELADGALPAGRPPESTQQAREAIGPDKLLVVYVPITTADAPDAVARKVRDHRAAGADHVIVGQSYDTDFAAAADHLAGLDPSALS